MDKREKEKLRQQEDEALTKLLWWVTGSAVLIVLLMIARRYRVDFNIDTVEIGYAVYYVTRVTTFIGLALAIAGAVLAVLRSRKGQSWMPFAGGAVFAAGFALSSFAVWKDNTGTRIDFVILLAVIVAVLAMVYFLYQRDFFVIAATVAVDIIGVWLLDATGRSPWSYLALAAAWVLFLAAVFLLQIMRNTKGILKLGGREVRILPAKSNYMLMAVSVLLMIVVMMVAVFLMGTGIPTPVFYAVPVAWGLIMAVFYTVKLM